MDTLSVKRTPFFSVTEYEKWTGLHASWNFEFEKGSTSQAKKRDSQWSESLSISDFALILLITSSWLHNGRKLIRWVFVSSRFWTFPQPGMPVPALIWDKNAKVWSESKVRWIDIGTHTHTGLDRKNMENMKNHVPGAPHNARLARSLTLSLSSLGLTLGSGRKTT